MNRVGSRCSAAGYKPFPLRSCFVGLICLFTILLIILMEISCRILPSENDNSAVHSTVRTTTIEARNARVHVEHAEKELSNRIQQRRQHSEAATTTQVASGPTSCLQQHQISISGALARCENHLMVRTAAAPRLPPITMTTTRYSRTEVTKYLDCVDTETEFLSTVTRSSHSDAIITAYESTTTAIVQVSSDTIYVTKVETMIVWVPLAVATTSTQYIDDITTEYLPAKTTTIHVSSVSTVTTTTVVYVLHAPTISSSVSSLARRSYDRYNNSANATLAGTTVKAEPGDDKTPTERDILWTTQYEQITNTWFLCSSTTTIAKPAKEVTSFFGTTSMKVAPSTITTTAFVHLHTESDGVGGPVIRTIEASIATITSTVIVSRKENFNRVPQGTRFLSVGTTTITRYATASLQQPAITKVVGYFSVDSTTVTQYLTQDLLQPWTTITELPLARGDSPGTAASVIILVSPTAVMPAGSQKATMYAREPLAWSFPLPGSNGILVWEVASLDGSTLASQSPMDLEKLSPAAARTTASPGRAQESAFSYITRTVEILTDDTPSPSVVYLTDAQGSTAATITLPAQPTTSLTTAPRVIMTEEVYVLTNAQYFIGFFLPTILAVLLSIPIHILNLNAMRYQPFHALTRDSGAAAWESLCLRTCFSSSIHVSLKSLRFGPNLPLLTGMLALLSTVLAPLASEAVGLKLVGDCARTQVTGCAARLAISTIPARITMALLIVILAILLVVLYRVRRWKTGVSFVPWSLAGIMALSSDAALRSLPGVLGSQESMKNRIYHRQLVGCFEGYSFRLGFPSHSSQDSSSYGILTSAVSRDAEQQLGTGGTSAHQAEPKAERGLPQIDRAKTPSFLNRRKQAPLISCAVFLVLACGLVVLVQYYNNTYGDTGFEEFMDQQTFGVRFFFTALGVAVSLFWSSFFQAMATTYPFRTLSHAKSASMSTRALTFSPPADPFTAIPVAACSRDVFFSIITFTTILSVFTPILLSNVPYGLTRTDLTEVTCTWLVTGILCWMVVVVLASCLFVRWVDLPAEPDSIAGLLYYVAGSKGVPVFEQPREHSTKELEERVDGLLGRFRVDELVLVPH